MTQYEVNQRYTHILQGGGGVIYFNTCEKHKETNNLLSND